MVQSDVDEITVVPRGDRKPFSIPITETEIEVAIDKMKVNNAKDEYDLVVEHPQFAKDEIIPFLTIIVNIVLNTAKMTNLLKGSVLHPLLNKTENSQYSRQI